MEQVAERDLPRGTGFDWTAMSYQEKAVGAQIYVPAVPSSASGTASSTAKGRIQLSYWPASTR
jgi:hypothetical protein